MLVGLGETVGPLLGFLISGPSSGCVCVLRAQWDSSFGNLLRFLPPAPHWSQKQLGGRCLSLVASTQPPGPCCRVMWATSAGTRA